MYAGNPASLIPVEHLYNPLGGTAADAEGVPVVSTDAANKKGNRTLNDFILVNTEKKTETLFHNYLTIIFSLEVKPIAFLE